MATRSSCLETIPNPPNCAPYQRSLVKRVVDEMFPLTFVGVLALALTTVDAVFLAQKFGDDVVVAIFGPIIYLTLTFGCLINGITLGVKIQIARLFAERADALRLRDVVATSFGVVVLCAAFLIAAWFANANWLTANMFPPESRPCAGAYLNAYFLTCFVPLAVYECAAKIFLAVKRPRLPVACAALAFALNVALDWLFVFPLDMGLAGSAYATALATCAAIALELTFLRPLLSVDSPASNAQTSDARRRRPRFDGETARFLQRKGSVLALDNFLFYLATLYIYWELNRFYASLGAAAVSAVAGISAANRLEAWVHNLQGAGQETTSTAVAHYSVSAPNRVRRAIACCAFLTVALSATLALTLYACRDWALELLAIQKGTTAYETAIVRLNYMTSTYWLCGVAGVLAHARRATGKVNFVFVVAIFSALTRIAWIYVVANYLENRELHHYLLAYPASWLAAIVLLFFGGKFFRNSTDVDG